jgi:sterol desaturase/sphingolipid hydroxylase (fatty acid hydroxylase superfamily)
VHGAAVESFVARFFALFRELLEPFEGVTSPVHRVYWPYLLSSAVLATWLWWRHLRRRTSLWRWLFPRKVWLHPSALLDYRFMVVRGALAALLLGPLTLSAQVLAVKSALMLSDLLGPGPGAEVSRAGVITIFTVLAFVVRDFFRFAMHWASHRFAPLWALHQVHHSAQVLTPLTLHRTHPLEGVLMRTTTVVALGLTGGVCEIGRAHV